jgi:hypothetical protein
VVVQDALGVLLVGVAQQEGIVGVAVRWRLLAVGSRPRPVIGRWCGVAFEVVVLLDDNKNNNERVFLYKRKDIWIFVKTNNFETFITTFF